MNSTEFDVMLDPRVNIHVPCDARGWSAGHEFGVQIQRGRYGLLLISITLVT